MVKGFSQKDLDQCSEAVDSYACFNLRRASRAITQFCDESLKGTGLRCTQLVILVTIPLLQDPSIAELAEALLMDRSTLTRNLRPLQKSKFVQLEEGEDRRKKIIRLTAKGKNRVNLGLPCCKRSHSKLIKKLGSKKWKEVLKNLNQIVSLIHSM